MVGVGIDLDSVLQYREESRAVLARVARRRFLDRRCPIHCSGGQPCGCRGLAHRVILAPSLLLAVLSALAAWLDLRVLDVVAALAKRLPAPSQPADRSGGG